MKRWIAVAAISLFAAGSMAQGIAEGTKELGLSGVLDFDTGVGSLFDLSVSYGYFLMDGLEVGGLR